MMAKFLNWYGRVALLGTPTSDGRILTDLFDDRLPVPVFCRAQVVGQVTRLRVFRSIFGTRPGAVWANLRLELDMLQVRLEHPLYPEIDIDVDTMSSSVPHDIRGALLAVTLGKLPTWPSLKPVIEVEP